MSGLELAVTWAAPPTGTRPLLVLGPSLGTSAQSLWGPCRDGLLDRFDVLAWDLPGHGASARATADFGVADLAAAVVTAVDTAVDTGDDTGDDTAVDTAGAGRVAVLFHYAGDSLGGAVGLQLLLDHPDRVGSAVLLCTGARIGVAQAWRERAELVRGEGTAALLASTPARWFGPGFTDREPAVAGALLDALRAADPTDYARACDALAAFDVRARLGEIRAPVLAVAGAADAPTPPANLVEIAAGVVDGRCVTLPGVGHLAPAEAPAEVARLVVEHALGPRTRAGT